MSQLNGTTENWKAAWVAWDPYDVCRRLVRRNPLCRKRRLKSRSRTIASAAREFWTTIAEYPEPLQDALFVIAESDGFDAALAALDSAIHEHRKKGVNGYGDAAETE